MRHAGVPYVVCWSTRVEPGAARLFSCAFFRALSSCRKSHPDYRAAFQQATLEVKVRPSMGARVPQYALRDPDRPAAASAATQGAAPKVAAGVPLLLCPDGSTCRPK